MKIRPRSLNVIGLSLLCVLTFGGTARGQFSQRQLSRLLERFPKADADGDGRLSNAEAKAYRSKLTGDAASDRPPADRRRGGVPRQFAVDPGWKQDRFPDHAVCYRSPQEIADLYATRIPAGRDAVISYPKPTDGSLRIVGTGHSFMGPGYKTFPSIARAAGFEQPPLVTHTGGGMTGSARYKWEQENGIFQFDGEPTPKLLASISNASWDAMMWGPYYQDEAAYYSCWIDFCLRYNPEMKFYLSDAWPQLDQLDEIPASEKELTPKLFRKMSQEKYAVYSKIIETLNRKYPGRVFVMPTCEAMLLAVESYHRGELPGVEGIHRVVGSKERSLWRDRLGHLGPGFDRLEGYVFYATLYGRSPELIKGEIAVGQRSNFPSPELDRTFRKIAWQAVLRNPLSGITDENGNGCCDRREE